MFLEGKFPPLPFQIFQFYEYPKLGLELHSVFFYWKWWGSPFLSSFIFPGQVLQVLSFCRWVICLWNCRTILIWIGLIFIMRWNYPLRCNCVARLGRLYILRGLMGHQPSSEHNEFRVLKNLQNIKIGARVYEVTTTCFLGNANDIFWAIVFFIVLQNIFNIVWGMNRNVLSLEADLRMKRSRLIGVWAQVYLRWSLFGIW